MGNEDLGKHLESIGDLNAAAETFSKMRPDVSTPKQFIDVGKHLVRLSVQRREWSMVGAHLGKMGGAGQYPEDDKAIQPYVKVAQGIAFLGQGKYLDAALSFLAADPAVSSSTYNELASGNDVAIYGGLLALASMDRKELQSQVLDNSKFRTFLELEPHIRRAVTQFVSGRYSACIAILESYRQDYLLDIYLQKHIQNIYFQIRSKCIVQYLIPFSCVSLETMNKAFGSPEQPIEDELADMIQSGTLQARINTIDKVNPRPLFQTSGPITKDRCSLLLPYPPTQGHRCRRRHSSRRRTTRDRPSSGFDAWALRPPTWSLGDPRGWASIPSSAASPILQWKRRWVEFNLADGE